MEKIRQLLISKENLQCFIENKEFLINTEDTTSIMKLIFLLAYFAFETGSGVEVLEERADGSKTGPFLIPQILKAYLTLCMWRKLNSSISLFSIHDRGDGRRKKKIPSNIFHLFTENKISSCSCPADGWLEGMT